MILTIDCSGAAFKYLMYPVKQILNILMIVCPILLVISLSIIIFKMVVDPEDKKLIKKLKNSIISLVIIFFVPLFVNVLMYSLGESTDVSSCWNDASNSGGSGSTYISVGDEGDKKSILIDPGAYEKGVPKQLDFDDYTGDGTVTAQFSSETMKIVEAHLNDFNYYTYNSFMSAHGGAGNYIKSLGGVFEKYYGGNKKISTVYEFQEVSEYVFGLMYIYGFDYYNGSKYCKWGGSCKSGSSGTSDAFYPGTLTHTSEGLSDNENFDNIVTAKDEMNMTTNCNWSVDMVYNKAGIYSGTKGAYFSKYCGTIIRNVEDFKVGDLIHFFSSPVDLDADPVTWNNNGWYHVAYVGEVYDDKVVFYDGGSYFTNNRNFKWSAKRSNSTKKLNGNSDWVACRITNLE